jgi:hypothetical protein
MSCHLKRGFQRSDFLLKYHQKPKVLRRRNIEKKRKRKEKKLQEFPQIKRGSQYLERRKHFNFKDPF